MKGMYFCIALELASCLVSLFYLTIWMTTLKQSQVGLAKCGNETENSIVCADNSRARDLTIKLSLTLLDSLDFYAWVGWMVSLEEEKFLSHSSGSHHQHWQHLTFPSIPYNSVRLLRVLLMDEASHTFLPSYLAVNDCFHLGYLTPFHQRKTL